MVSAKHAASTLTPPPAREAGDAGKYNHVGGLRHFPPIRPPPLTSGLPGVAMQVCFLLCPDTPPEKVSAKGSRGAGQKALVRHPPASATT